jgi:FAD/FMN-containing dehydrogenase
MSTLIANESVLNLQALRDRVIGAVLEPMDAGYLEAVTGWALKDRHRPIAVVVAQTRDDVTATVNFARANGLTFSVQSTGHGSVRANRGGLLLNISSLTGIQIDPEAKTATVEAGVTWAQLLEAARPHGLTGLVGDTPSVGVIGFTLGGGMGWFGRQYGLACDSLLEVELVTADGELRVVNAKSDHELFWALRGGAGGFGVVTRMTLRLYPVAQTFSAQLIFPMQHARGAWIAYRDLLKNAPDAMTSRVMVMRGPDIEAMPPFLRNRTALMLQLCYTGDHEEGRRVLEPLLGLPGSIAEIVQPVAPADLGAFFGAPPAPVKAPGRAEQLPRVTDETIDALLALASTEPAPPFLLEVRHLGGAVGDVPVNATAFAHRKAAFLANFHALPPVPVLEEPAQAMTEAFTNITARFASGEVMPNFLNGDEGALRDSAAYPGIHGILLHQAKRKYDPTNLLSLARTPGSRV